MASFNDIATSLRVDTQLPLDHKQFAVSQLVLSDLGDENNLAFTYYDNLKVFCWNEKTEWVWREVKDGEEDTGLVPSDFVYPNGAVYPNPGYEGKAYNFFPITPGTETKIEAGTSISITGDGSLNDPYIINNTFVYVPLPSDTAPLKKDNEGDGAGIYLRDRNPSFYGRIGQNAFDISYSSLASENVGAMGKYSFAQGETTYASGLHSMTMGKTINNSGDYSFAAGKGHGAAAHKSFTAGLNNISVGKTNTVFGVGNSANGVGIMIVGQAANVVNTSDFSGFNTVPNKPIFVVGNGAIDGITELATSRSDAFLVRYNGAIEAPSLTIAGITSGVNRTLVTKEYLNSVLVPKTFRKYVVLLSQTGTNNPVIVGTNPLINELGGNIVWTRNGFTGSYSGTLFGGFTTGKTTIFVQDHYEARKKISGFVVNVNSVNIFTYDSSTPMDGILNNTAIEITIYN